MKNILFIAIIALLGCIQNTQAQEIGLISSSVKCYYPEDNSMAFGARMGNEIFNTEVDTLEQRLTISIQPEIGILRRLNNPNNNTYIDMGVVLQPTIKLYEHITLRLGFGVRGMQDDSKFFPTAVLRSTLWIDKFGFTLEFQSRGPEGLKDYEFTSRNQTYLVSTIFSYRL